MDKRFIFRYHPARAMGGRSRVDTSGPIGHGQFAGVASPRREIPGDSGEASGEASEGRLESSSPGCREKPLSVEGRVSVPQTDTGREVEDTKAIERTLVKELGKLPP